MTRFILAGAAAFTMATGLAWAEAPATTKDASGHAGGTMMACPMNVQGAKVSTAHTSDGEALTFSSTRPEEVTELRRRVHAAAEMHNKNHGSDGTHGDMMGDEMMGGMVEGDHMAGGMMGSDHMTGGATGSGHMTGGTMMPQSHATVADVDKGARITLTPSSSADLQKLQSAIRVRVERMQKSGCGKMAQK